MFKGDFFSFQFTVMMPPSGSYERLRRVMENERVALSFQFTVMMPPSGSYERLRRVVENEREALG